MSCLKGLLYVQTLCYPYLRPFHIIFALVNRTLTLSLSIVSLYVMVIMDQDKGKLPGGLTDIKIKTTYIKWIRSESIEVKIDPKDIHLIYYSFYLLYLYNGSLYHILLSLDKDETRSLC